MQAVIDRIPSTRIETAVNVAACLDVAETLKPDVILIDINLPGSDGKRTLSDLRENAATKDIPVIAISLDATASDRRRAKRAGFHDLLGKPVDIPAVERAIEECVPR